MEEAKLIDYTKFRLKPEEEIKEIFKTVNQIFIIECRKCYKKFDNDTDEEYNRLLDILGGDAKKITGYIGIDFLCNSFLSRKKILNLDSSDMAGAGFSMRNLKTKFSDSDSIGVISCGLGVQFVAQILEGKTVYALADSLPQSANSTSEVGYHGISLEKEKCAGCSECYLNLTAGICPVTNCPKGLLNGPCGGAKNGKCEVNPNIDCVWEKIYERLKKQGRRLTLNSVQIRNYSKPSLKLKESLSLQNQTLRSESFYGGFHPLDKKEETENKKIENFPEPEIATIFLSQHTGKRAKLLVKVGDRVRRGQKIGEAEGFVSASIHSSVSGKVVSIEERIHPVSQKKDLALIIENDGRNLIDSSIKPHKDFEDLSKETLLKIIREKGIVGLGGAMFPTSVKLSPPKPIDSLIINGCECEPYLNSDNRMMIEHAQEIFKGMRIVQKILEVKEVFIGVENNKPEAIKSLQEGRGDFSSLKIVPLKTKYPQGAEKMLIKKILGREVPQGGLPFNVGTIVLNVSTIFAIYQAVVEGLPLTQRAITISGEDLSKPGNYFIKIGTPLKDIVQCSLDGEGGEFLEKYDLKMGGPIMGISQTNLDSAVIKGTTGITFLKKSLVKISEDRDCIKCGRCVEVCPMELYPLYFAFYGKKGDWEKARDYKVEDCIECGCCEAICSSKIPILSFIKKEKEYARNANKA